MKIEKNTAEGQTSVAREATNVVMTPEDKSEETLSGRVLSQSARAAALAYDEVFKLKHELAIAQQPERDRIAPQVHALQEQISDLTAQLEATRAALFEHRLQKKFIQQSDRAHALQSYNDEILASTSWRVTSPLRRVSLTLRRVKSVVCR